MAIEKEWRCRAHGEFVNASGKCPGGCRRDWVVREIRTAPAFRRSGAMRFVDKQLQGIAAENGLSDMRVDPKDGNSVMDREMRKRELASRALEKQTGAKIPRQHWGEVPHAAPGFSRDPKITRPQVSASQFGTQKSAAAEFYKTPPPPPRPIIVGQPKD